MSNKAVIIDGVRSPIGTKGSPMIGMRSDEIAGQVIKGLLERNEKLDKNLLRYLTVRVKKFDLETDYFKKNDEKEMLDK